MKKSSIDSDRLYTILPNPNRYILCGKIGAKSVAIANTSMRLITFDSNGEIERLDAIVLNEAEPPKERLNAWLKASNFLLGPIAVKRFLIDDKTIGVKPLPDYIQEYLEHPTLYTGFDKENFAEMAEVWLKSQMYVLCWGEEYDCNRDGSIISS